MFRPNRKMQEILEAHAAMGGLPIETLSAEAARQMPTLDRAVNAVYGKHVVMRALGPIQTPVGRVEHRQLPGLGCELLVRIYYPEADAPRSGWPVVVYFHGGGFVLGTLDSYDASCRALCDQAECVVVSCHYRQAPEHPWPAAIEDAFAAYQWTLANAASFNGNPALVAVAGEGSGGNLAAVTCLCARDKKIQAPVHQLLIYPATDIEGGADNLSAFHHSDARPLSRAIMKWQYEKYAPAIIDPTHAYLSPLHAMNLAGLPSATIINAEVDPLRDDGEAYADRLDQAKVHVNWKLYSGVTHEFFGMTGVLDEAGQAVALAADDLRESFEYAEENAPVTA